MLEGVVIRSNIKIDKNLNLRTKKTLQPFTKQALVFMCLQNKTFENTVGKGEIARNEQFLLFPQWFLAV